MGAKAAPARRRAPGKQRKRAADEQTQDAENEDAARRINGEGVNRGQDAGAHEEGAEQREREGEDGEQYGPHLQGVALFHDEGGMQQRGATSQGMKLAFSTGTQNHQPPQPSS